MSYILITLTIFVLLLVWVPVDDSPVEHLSENVRKAYKDVFYLKIKFSIGITAITAASVLYIKGYLL